MVTNLPDGAVRVAVDFAPVSVTVLHEIVVKRIDGTAALWVLRMVGIKSQCVGSYASSFTQFVFECDADRVRGLAVLVAKGIWISGVNDGD